MSNYTWSEADHPRDNEGKFTYKNGGDYHSSKDDLIKRQIEKENKEQKEAERRAEILYPTMKNKGGITEQNKPIFKYANTKLGGDVLKQDGKQGTPTGGATDTKTIDNSILTESAWEKTRNFIIDKEKFSSKAYKPTKDDKWTIGYGHTEGVKEGDVITKEQADKLFRQDFYKYSKQLKYVTVKLNDNEKVALISFVYNVGPNAFKNSTLLKKLNQGDKNGAAEEFGKWVRQNGKILPGLVNRRQQEKELFMKP